jgi:hypothetical protein
LVYFVVGDISGKQKVFSRQSRLWVLGRCYKQVVNSTNVCALNLIAAVSFWPAQRAKRFSGKKGLR